MCSPRKTKQKESTFVPVVQSFPVLQYHVTTFQIMAGAVEGGMARERPLCFSQCATKAVYLSLKPSQCSSENRAK